MTTRVSRARVAPRTTARRAGQVRRRLTSAAALGLLFLSVLSLHSDRLEAIGAPGHGPAGAALDGLGPTGAASSADRSAEQAAAAPAAAMTGPPSGALPAAAPAAAAGESPVASGGQGAGGSARAGVITAAHVVVPVVPVGGEIAQGRQSAARADAAIDSARDAGAVGIRAVVDLDWLCPSSTCHFGAALGPLVTRARADGLRVYLQVNSTPGWLDPRGRWYGPTGAIGRQWAALFAQLTDTFGTSVAGYEVWNEPDLQEFWAQGPDPAQYADLLRSVWTAVKAGQPRAQLVGGILSNNDLGWMHQLDVALKAIGGGPANHDYYDLLGVHPYSGTASSGYDPDLAAGSHVVDLASGPKDMTFQGVARLRAQVARDEGIERDVVIGEFGYDTHPGSWYYEPEARRASYLARAVRIAATWPWLQAFSIYSYSGLPTDGFSVVGTPSQAAVEPGT